MDEMEAFKNRIFSLKNKEEILLPFFNLEQQAIIKSCFNKNDYNKVCFYGGYDNSEYKRALITSREVLNNDFNIVCYKINPLDKNVILNHRQILGSILSLGLKREIIGDIIELNNEYYFFVTLEMANFVKSNLNKIGKYNIYLEEVKQKIEYEVKYVEEIIFISSLRLDNIVSNGYKIARKKAQEIIDDGNVKINHQIITNYDKIVKKDDLLSIKGKGRLIVSETLGKSKSGNIILKIKKPEEK